MSFIEHSNSHTNSLQEEKIYHFEEAYYHIKSAQCALYEAKSHLDDFKRHADQCSNLFNLIGAI